MAEMGFDERGVPTFRPVGYEPETRVQELVKRDIALEEYRASLARAEAASDRARARKDES